MCVLNVQECLWLSTLSTLSRLKVRECFLFYFLFIETSTGRLFLIIKIVLFLFTFPQSRIYLCCIYIYVNIFFRQVSLVPNLWFLWVNLIYLFWCGLSPVCLIWMVFGDLKPGVDPFGFLTVSIQLGTLHVTSKFKRIDFKGSFFHTSKESCVTPK